MSRFARFAANIRFNLYGQVVQAALPFFFIPFILKYLGREAYGLYALIGVLTSQLNLLSFGAGPATLKYLAEFDSAGDFSRVNRLIGNSLAFYGAIGFLGAGIILLFAPLFENRLLSIPPGLEPAAHFVFLCAASIFLIQSLARTFHAIPQALQRFDAWNGAETTTALVLNAGIYVLLKRGWWVRGLAAWSIAAAAVNLALYAWMGKKLLPGMSLRPAYEREMMQKITRFGGWLFVSQIGWSVMYQMDKLVLGSFIPLADLTYYLIAFNLSQKLPILLGPVLPIILPFSSALHGRKDYDTARQLYLSGTKLSVIVLLPALVLAFFFAPAFLELWLGGHFSEHAGWVLRLLLMGTFMAAIGSFGNLITQGFGQVRTPTLLWVSCLTLAAALWFIFIPIQGILAAAWIFGAIQTLHTTVFFTWCNTRLLQVPWRRFLKALWKPLLLSLPLMALSFLARNSLKNWVELISYGLISYIAYAGACYRFALGPEERERIRMLREPKSVAA